LPQVVGTEGMTQSRKERLVQVFKYPKGYSKNIKLVILVCSMDQQERHAYRIGMAQG